MKGDICGRKLESFAARHMCKYDSEESATEYGNNYYQKTQKQ